MTSPQNNLPFFCSWSGGKDSCLALYQAIQAGGKPECLLTMMIEDGVISRSHGISRKIIQQQARLMGIPVVFRSATWDEYEKVFVATLREFEKQGIKAGVFGDIDVLPHLEWCQKVCAAAGIIPQHPLWKRERRQLLDEFINLGFRATIIVVDKSKLDERFLGREINAATIRDLEEAGVDASGELGEYHTIVTTGPFFSSPLPLITRGIVRHDGYGFLQIDCPGSQRMPNAETRLLPLADAARGYNGKNLCNVRDIEHDYSSQRPISLDSSSDKSL